MWRVCKCTTHLWSNDLTLILLQLGSFISVGYFRIRVVIINGQFFVAHNNNYQLNSRGHSAWLVEKRAWPGKCILLGKFSPRIDRAMIATRRSRIQIVFLLLLLWTAEPAHDTDKKLHVTHGIPPKLNIYTWIYLELCKWRSTNNHVEWCVYKNLFFSSKIPRQIIIIIINQSFTLFIAYHVRWFNCIAIIVRLHNKYCIE